jgi:hypothetical protein
MHFSFHGVGGLGLTEGWWCEGFGVFGVLMERGAVFLAQIREYLGKVVEGLVGLFGFIHEVGLRVRERAAAAWWFPRR